MSLSFLSRHPHEETASAMLTQHLNSYLGADPPASITFTFALSISARFSQIRLLMVCVRGIEGVSLCSYQRPLQCKSQPSESPCNIEFSTMSFRQLCRQTLENTQRLRAQPPTQFVADQFHRARANFAPVPTFFVFSLSWVAANPPCLADSPQPLVFLLFRSTNVPPWDPGDYVDPRHPDLFHAILVLTST